MTAASLRLQLLVIVTLAGVVALLASMTALRFELSSMMLRYPLAIACGYVAFLLLIRLWIAWHRRDDVRTERGHLVDAATSFDISDLRIPSRGVPDASMSAAGRSGGGGAGASWFDGAGASRARLAPSTGKSSGWNLDLDDVWPVVLAVACALGAVVAIGYVIYTAPVMLGEIAVDAAIVSGLYRRLRKKAPAHWAVTTVKHTWIPATALLMFAALGGFAMERIAPEAQSVGGVVRALTR